MNILVAGIFIARLKKYLIEIKILFPGMLSAMLLTTGITLPALNIILFSFFNIGQQKEPALLFLSSRKEKRFLRVFRKPSNELKDVQRPVSNLFRGTPMRGKRCSISF